MAAAISSELPGPFADLFIAVRRRALRNP